MVKYITKFWLDKKNYRFFKDQFPEKFCKQFKNVGYYPLAMYDTPIQAMDALMKIYNDRIEYHKKRNDPIEIVKYLEHKRSVFVNYYSKIGFVHTENGWVDTKKELV